MWRISDPGRHRTWVKIKSRPQVDAAVLAVSWGRDGELHVLRAEGGAGEIE